MGKKNPLIDHEGNMVWIFPMVWWYNFDKRGLALIGVGIWAFFLPFWRFLGIFRHFQASENHTMYDTLIENWVLRSDWGSTKFLGPTGREILNYEIFGPFWAILTFLGIFRHFPMGSNKFLQISPNSQSFSTLKFKYVSLRHIVLTCDI